MATQTDSRQVKKRQALQRLGTAAQATLESILDKANTEVDSPLRLTASATPDAVLNFSSSQISAADLAKKVVSPVKKQIFASLSSPTINFQTQALSNAADFDITFPASTVGQFRHVGFTLIGSGKIKALFSAEAATEGALSNPGALFVSGGLPIGYVTLECTNASPAYFKTAGSVTNIIENAKIFRFGSGAGGSGSGTGTGTGAEVIDLRYRAELQDSFQDIPGDETPVDISTDKTDPSLHDVANELFRLNYDASKTVTGTGTSMSLSAAPAYTVKKGDVLVVGSEVREITVLGNINVDGTGFTIASAFTVDPAAAVACVSQAVYTKDLNSFDANGTGLAVNSQIPDDVSTVLVNYEDSLTLGDVIPDWGTVAHVAYHVTADNVTWGDALTRKTDLSEETLSTSTPTADSQLRLRFFANKTSGSGAVNLLNYKVFWHEETSAQSGANYNTAFANLADSDFVNVSHGVAGGKSRFTFTWSYPIGLDSLNPAGSALEVFVNGQQVPRFVSGVTSTSQAYFTEISANIIEMDTDYSATGLEFIFKVPVTVVDSNNNNTSRIAALEASADQYSGDVQVSPSWLTAVNGTPTATQFRSDITGRKSIVDLSKDLAVQMASYRILSQFISQVTEESSSTGQLVYRSANDRLDQVRFVGNWSSIISTNGPEIQITTAAIPLNSYIEVVFWGTGLNLLMAQIGNSNDARVSIDGAAEGSNIFPAATSAAINARGYSPYIQVSAASGLTPGLHTAKIRWNTSGASADVQGVEILNDAAILSVKPGTILKGKQVNTLAVLSTTAYNSSFESGTLGTRGGNVVVYVNADGTVGKAVTPTNASSANLTSTDHTNEELVRTYHFREFGANRADDFSTVVNSASNRAFCLDDNITALIGNNVVATVPSGNAMEGLAPSGVNGAVTFEFVGTGLDVGTIVQSGGTSANYSIFVDGVAIATNIAGSTLFGAATGITKIVSGLPFGFHTVRVVCTAVVANGIYFDRFLVYGPKKPTIPSTAIEIAQYYLTANYDGTTITGTTIADQWQTAVGTVFKNPTREGLYVGANWTIALAQTSIGGLNASTLTNNSQPTTYRFYGTGFVTHIGGSSLGTYDYSVAIDGVLNATGVARSNATNLGAGSYRCNTTTSTAPCRVEFTGLSLGWHTVTIQRTAGTGNFGFDGLSIICPVFNYTSNSSYSQQNTLSVSSFLGDSRKWNPRDVLSDGKKYVSQAFGIQSGPTMTSTTPIPMPDMSVGHYNRTGRVKVSYSIVTANSQVNGFTGCYIYVNAKQFNNKGNNHSTATAIQTVCDSVILEVPVGFNKFDIYWAVNGGNTGSAYLTWRNMTVEEA